MVYFALSCPCVGHTESDHALSDTIRGGVAGGFHLRGDRLRCSSSAGGLGSDRLFRRGAVVNSARSGVVLQVVVRGGDTDAGVRALVGVGCVVARVVDSDRRRCPGARIGWGRTAGARCTKAAVPLDNRRWRAISMVVADEGIDGVTGSARTPRPSRVVPDERRHHGEVAGGAFPQVGCSEWPRADRMHHRMPDRHIQTRENSVGRSVLRSLGGNRECY